MGVHIKYYHTFEGPSVCLEQGKAAKTNEVLDNDIEISVTKIHTNLPLKFKGSCHQQSYSTNWSSLRQYESAAQNAATLPRFGIDDMPCLQVARTSNFK